MKTSVRTRVVALGLFMATAWVQAAEGQKPPALKQDKELSGKLAQCAATYTASARLQLAAKQNADSLLEQGQWYYDGAIALADEPFAKAQFIVRSGELTGMLPKDSMPRDQQIADLKRFMGAINGYVEGCEQLRAIHAAMLKPYLE